MMKKLKALSNATWAAILLIVGMTIFGELFPLLKTIIAKVGGHHWLGKSIISLVFFILFYMFTYHKVHKDLDVKKDLRNVMVVTVLSGLALLLFFTYEFFK